MKEHRKKISIDEPPKKADFKKMASQENEPYSSEILMALNTAVGGQKRAKIAPEDIQDNKRQVFDVLSKFSMDLRNQPDWEEVFTIDEWQTVKTVDDLKALLQTKREWVRILQFYHFVFGNPDPIIRLNFEKDGSLKGEVDDDDDD